ncbi:dihydroneopterin aldolase [Campylobacter sp. faydin G-105]|uniref:dihydroneopterin aldolase n=1 Tax=Campylobacter anatolicus TaxID=2829105 RepID=UPI001B9549F8|nr:dihydroneopterin aldolase [Campylobacter anatolicus]MBR8461837.1 dihydroneopterin aldolase [Campylobacter anatolicus]
MKEILTTIIKDYEFSTIIGMLDFERTNPQKVRINLSFESIEFVDYVSVIEFIEKFYNERKFYSVEESLQISTKALKENFKAITSINFEILKVEIVKNALVGARLEIVY